MNDQTPYEWHPCDLILPRIGLLLKRDGVHTRLLWPGSYFIRRSRTLRKPIYRRRSSLDRDG